MNSSNEIKVDIIVATYNSNGYIEEQLDSILSQTYQNIRVLVRDDGSSDDTVNIVKNIASKDHRVELIEDDSSSNGVGENFKKLLTHCNAEYVLLSDQDDVWLDNKIEVLVKFANENFDNATPSIAYAPGLVVDSNLIGNGLLTNYKNKATSFNDILLMNGGIQGCAMIVNKSLYCMALKKDFYWYMHDQVLTLFALAFGSTYFINKALFLYRQHNFNVLGYNSSTKLLKIKKYLFSSDNTYVINIHSVKLFKEFLKLFSSEMKYADTSLMKGVVNLSNKSKSHQIIFIIKNKVHLEHSLIKAIAKVLFATNFIETPIFKNSK